MQIIRIFLISAGLTGLAWLVPIAGQSQEFRKISPRDTFDVAVLMSNPAGIAAAVTAARLGMRTALITESGEPLVVDGWQPDPVTPSLRLAAGGFFREFSDSIRARYREKNEEKPVAFRECREGFSFEPSVAEEVLERLLLNQPGLTLFRDFTFDALPENLVENTAGRGRDIRIHRVGKSSRERWIRATVWIDASEYGALASALGCRFRTGRESREETGEIQAPNSAPIPSEDSLTPVIAWLTCDSFLQPPAFSLCLTRKTENFSPFREPGSYHRDAYAALAQALRTGKINAFVSGPGMPYKKYSRNRMRTG
jgi:hypothetical protein